MDINLVYDPSVSVAPSGFTVALTYAAQILDHLITDPITVNISVGWGEIGGTPISSGAEGGPANGTVVPYTTLLADLRTHADLAAAQEAIANAPTYDPSGGAGFFVSSAQEKAWGMLPANASGLDGQVGFSDYAGYDFSTTNLAVPGEWDFVGVALHELTHALGRVSGLQPNWGNLTVLDLFQYAAPGQIDLSSYQPAYFSIDGGHTSLGTFDDTLDWADWTSSVPADAFDLSGALGTDLVLSPTDVTLMDAIGFDVACFAAGTRIRTSRGDVPVEALRAGEDRAITASGAARRIIWVGQRNVATARHRRPADVMPVRVRRNAVAPGQPARDLLLSPDHALYLDGVLIPVRYLVNGRTIVQEAVARITYCHVELERHDVLLVEGLAAESYLDTGNRRAFAGGQATPPRPEVARRIWARRACAPLVLAGPKLARARARLLRRAVALGHRVTADPALEVTAAGRSISLRRSGAFGIVDVPPGADTLCLRSRSWVPTQMHPQSTDSRRLGIALTRLWLDWREAALDSPGFLRGWHGAEQGLRWSDGEGVLAMPEAARHVAFEIAPMGCYWATAPVQAAPADADGPP